MHLMICSPPTQLAGIVLHHAFDEIRSNGGRAEPVKKANENRFFMAHVPLSLSPMLVRVDVPRFELGASTMPR